MSKEKNGFSELLSLRDIISQKAGLLGNNYFVIHLWGHALVGEGNPGNPRTIMFYHSRTVLLYDYHIKSWVSKVYALILV